MNLKILATASVLAVAAMVGSVSAATLSGTFKVTAVNVTNLNSTESQATGPIFGTPPLVILAARTR